MPYSERTPLLEDHVRNFWSFGQETREDYHTQFCRLVGIPPSDWPHDEEPPPIGPKSLYGRALRMKANQGRTYAFTAAISNTLLLSQVVLGAAVTALGASASSHILITIFGAANTIIAGVVAYLKSRGQPMRARMYRDDLERVVDEIENSEVMWLGISKNMHGYQAINTDDEVTVRSEVARLTRLYDRAVRTNTMNNPDMYMANGTGEGTTTGLRKGPVPAASTQPPAAQPLPGPANAQTPAPPAAPAVADPDESPATAPPKPKEEPKKDDKDDKDNDSKATSHAPATEPPKDANAENGSAQNGNAQPADSKAGSAE